MRVTELEKITLSQNGSLYDMLFPYQKFNTVNFSYEDLVLADGLTKKAIKYYLNHSDSRFVKECFEMKKTNFGDGGTLF